MKQIPNIFTLLNLVFGCLAIIFTLQTGLVIAPDEQGVQFYIPEKIWMASLCIGIAAVIDFLDGFVARLFNANSEMGKQLDSLADLVSFGVAPGIILYQFLRLSFAQEAGGLDTSIVWLLPAFLVPMAAAWRLARYNLDKEESQHFKGLPVPSTGIFVASLPLIYWNVNAEWVYNMLHDKWILYGICLVLSGLMVSTIPLMSLKFKDYSLKNNWPKYLLVLVALISVFILKWLAPPFIILFYVLLSLLFKRKIT